jgi:hypothetical protein
MLPYVRAWEAKYRDVGLVVIGLHTPEFVFERDIDNVRHAVAAHDIEFPVVLDSDYEIWRAFDNHYWPALYLADDRGFIRYHQFGEGRYAESERAIQQLLIEAGVADVDDHVVAANGAGPEAPADWGELESAETYLGYARAEGFASVGGITRDLPRHYAAPDDLRRNSWALSGEWTFRPDRVTAAGPHARVVVRFHARDLHLVMAPADREVPVPFRMSIDGEVPGDAHGLDVDEDGMGVVLEPRMYQLIRQQRSITDRTVDIAFDQGVVEAFVITFG